MESTNALPSPLPPSRVSTEAVGRAVGSLLKWVKSKAKNQKAQLLDHDELLYLVLTLKKIPPTARNNPYKIPLPHPLFHSPSLEICLIIDDRPKSHLTADGARKKIQSESIPVSKVLKVSKLKSDYRPFEAKRQLCGSYDIFFADKRVIPLLPSLLGKQFFKKKKIPIPIDLKHKNWKEQISHSCGSTLLYLRTGTCCILKVAWASQNRDEIVENVLAAIQGAVELVPKKWANIRSFHLKSLDSVALPLYQAVPEMGLKIEGFKEDDGEKNEENGAKTAGSENGIEEDKENKSEKKKKKKVPKKGRIHEVRYMDRNIEELMGNMVGDDGDANEAGELGGVETTKKKKKKKAAEGELPNKAANLIDDDRDASEVDGLGGVQSTEKHKITKKREKTATGELLLPKKSAKMELEKGSPDAAGMKKKKKRIKAEEAEEKEKKIMKKESKRRRKAE